MTKGTPDDPWTLKTPPGSSEYQAWREVSADPPALVVQVGTTQANVTVPRLEVQPAGNDDAVANAALPANNAVAQ